MLKAINPRAITQLQIIRTLRGMPSEGYYSSYVIADRMNHTDPHVVRACAGQLVRAGWLESRQHVGGGYRLTEAARAQS